MFFVREDNIEARLLLDFVDLRALSILEFDAESWGWARFHLDSLLALDWAHSQLAGITK